MPREKKDRRRSSQGQSARSTRREATNRKRGPYTGTMDGGKLKRALLMMVVGNSQRSVAVKLDIPRSTLGDEWKRFKNSGLERVDDYIQNRSSRLVLFSEEEEKAIVHYLLWQMDKGDPIYRNDMKGIMREIHARGMAAGDKRLPINVEAGPSDKYIQSFLEKYPSVSPRLAETVDRGRINMANQETISKYFELLKETLVRCEIAKLDESGNIDNDSISAHKIYLADETGWGVQSKRKKVMGRKGAKHVYIRKPSDESHKTLMLGVNNGNGDVLKSLIVLEKSFPLLAEGEASHLPDDILLSKTENGSMEKQLFVDWLKHSVIPHKQEVNPDGKSLLILDNHGSRFSCEAIDLCIENNIEILLYPGHLTHILQGPDVVLNKPISVIVDRMIQNNIHISGNSDLTRVAFLAIIVHAVKTVCTREMVEKAFSATGVIPFNPNRINLSSFPTSMQCSSEPVVSPVKATCKECRVKNVELHPLVKQGIIPKHLADAFMYTPPPQKTKLRSKVVQYARIATSAEVKAEVVEKENRNRNKGKGKKPAVDDVPTAIIEKPTCSKKVKKASKFPRIKLKPSEEMHSEGSDDEEEGSVCSWEERSDDEEEEGGSRDEGSEEEANEGESENDWRNYQHRPLPYDDVKIGLWVIVEYEGEYFIGLVIAVHKLTRTARVTCLEHPFGISSPQNMEKETIAADYSEEKLFVAPVKPKGVKVGRMYKYEY